MPRLRSRLVRHSRSHPAASVCLASLRRMHGSVACSAAGHSRTQFHFQQLERALLLAHLEQLQAPLLIRTEASHLPHNLPHEGHALVQLLHRANQQPGRSGRAAPNGSSGGSQRERGERQRVDVWCRARTPLRYDGFGFISSLVTTLPWSMPTAKPVLTSPLGWPVVPANRVGADMAATCVQTAQAPFQSPGQAQGTARERHIPCARDEPERAQHRTYDAHPTKKSKCDGYILATKVLPPKALSLAPGVRGPPPPDHRPGRARRN